MQFYGTFEIYEQVAITRAASKSSETSMWEQLLIIYTLMDFNSSKSAKLSIVLLESMVLFSKDFIGSLISSISLSRFSFSTRWQKKPIH